ncbi:IS630 family transposase [Deinococcus aquaedulcis]|uniref:IS630 family transposase n=1 Tax=Deinococcus aquaedulcis TaxID=2840455 RepID=UPI002E2CB009|nr:IS630 family transposase [Deinococcus aquaedulcis]
MIPPCENGAFVAAMEHVLDLYAEPFDAAFRVVCFDERPCQLIADVVQPTPLQPGQPFRYDYEYERRGTANLFGYLEPKGNRRWLDVTERRTKADFARCMQRLVDEFYPAATKIRLVLDNLSTHSKGVLYETFGAAEAHRIASKLEFHFTPKHGSWLNAVEIEFAALSKQCLDRRIGSKEELHDEVQAWVAERNRQKRGVNWTFSTAMARQKLARLYPTNLANQS